MVRVLGLVSFRIFPTHMGGQKGVANFYQYLSERAQVVLAASYDNKDSGALELHRVLHPNRKMYRNIFKVKGLKRLVNELKIDVLVAEHSYTGWLAWLLKRATGKPFIIHSHNIESKRFRHMKKPGWHLYQWYEGWIHRKADHNFFISREDLDHAVKNFRLKPERCTVITYGVSEKTIPDDRGALRRQLGWEEENKVWLFNGTMDYQPNYDAVLILVQKIEPLLREKTDNYRILITGNRAPASLIAEMQKNDHVHYEGYVDDIDVYYSAADLFLNPVAQDTGVKTKLVEAIANGCPTISTAAGASGLRTDLCGDQLTIVNDNNWNDFVQKMLEWQDRARTKTPAEFYKTYGWRHITAKAAEVIEAVTEKYRAPQA